ncbi:molecular chaperone (plasmid) [Fulvitalea axinellae]|uniref:Molecular chaperone n=1 Tax=Fulvitalea axinellae TaxID=1182444 RepID=A0AAU9CY35_9BACT|nr:molecular chaperone [Fulvitalea axinellae]
MTLVRIANPYSDLVDRFLDNELFNWSNRNHSRANTTVPAVNVKEDSDRFLVSMAAPGLERENFNVELNNNLLTISCETSDKDEQREGETVLRSEYSYQSFSRSFTLPTSVKEDDISATYNSGVLEVVLPKREEAKPKPTRLIEIV